MDVQARRESQERLKIEVKLLLTANRKSYMPRRLAQQRMTLSDLEWPFQPHICAVAELLVFISRVTRAYATALSSTCDIYVSVLMTT